MQGNLRLKAAVRLLKWNEIYGFKEYCPTIVYLHSKQPDVDRQGSQWVYDFKKRGKYRVEVGLLLEALRVHLKCDEAIAIPPSSPDDQPNELQRLLGVRIQRTKEVTTRKFHHTKELCKGYGKSYMVNGVVGPRILLVDDIVTTGRTLNHFREALTKKGFEVEMAALGIHYKRDYRESDSLAVFIQETQAEAELKSLLKEIGEI